MKKIINRKKSALKPSDWSKGRFFIVVSKKIPSKVFR